MNLFLTWLPWGLFPLGIIVSLILFKLLKNQRAATRKETIEKLKAEQKARTMKENIDRLTAYNSSDSKIRKEAVKNVQDLRRATKDKDVKEKLLQLHFNLSNIYYGK